MNNNMGTVNIKIRNNTLKAVLRELDKCKKRRLHELKSLPDDYKLKHLKIRQNEISTMYESMKTRIEKMFLFVENSEQEGKNANRD